MSANYFGTVNCIAPFLPQLLQRGSGHIVGMCSLASMRGLLHATSYSASKAAQLSFLESIRLITTPWNPSNHTASRDLSKHRWQITMNFRCHSPSQLNGALKIFPTFYCPKKTCNVSIPYEHSGSHQSHSSCMAIRSNYAFDQ